MQQLAESRRDDEKYSEQISYNWFEASGMHVLKIHECVYGTSSWGIGVTFPTPVQWGSATACQTCHVYQPDFN